MADNLLVTLFPIVLIGLIGLVVGAVLGTIIAGIQRGSDQPDAEAPGKQYSQVVRLWRDRRSEKLALEYDGEVFYSSSKLTNSQKDQLGKILGDFNFWLGLGDLSGREQRLQSVLNDYATGAQPPAEVVLPSMTAAGAFGAEIGVESGKGGAENLSLISRLTGLDQKPAEPPKEAEKSIATQIDELLQEKLPFSLLRDHSIRLLELPDRGMVVFVDGESYDGVGDVPDPEVRQFIQSCVAEWESLR